MKIGMHRPAKPGDTRGEGAQSVPTTSRTPTAGNDTSTRTSGAAGNACPCQEGGTPPSGDVHQTDRELLAKLVGGGTTARSAGRTDILVDRLFARFGSVAELIRAHPADVAIVDGISQATAARIAAAFELTRRAAIDDAPEKITGQSDLVDVVAPLLRGRSRERAVVVSCDRVRRVLGCDVISEGSADRALMPPREAMVSVLRRDGMAFAVAHNHPSGDPTPSVDDLHATARIAQAARAAGLEFMGHVVVTETEWRYVLGYGLGLLRSPAPD